MIRGMEGRRGEGSSLHLFLIDLCSLRNAFAIISGCCFVEYCLRTVGYLGDLSKDFKLLEVFIYELLLLLGDYCLREVFEVDHVVSRA